MRKYIRTKGNQIGFIPDKSKYCYFKNWIVENNEILKNSKQADTIDELCDRYILKGIDIINLNKERTKYCFEGEETWYDITDTEIKCGIYGAIWTDKGLIYKAKLNDKGDFELL